MTAKRALMLASVASMIDQFNMPNISLLQQLGYQTDVVADFSHPGTITLERAEALKAKLTAMGVEVRDIAIPRSLNPRAVVSAYRKVRAVLCRNHYDLIHCHSPIGGAICRLAAKAERKKGTRVIYTAHGFHFYAGAPAKNWIVFYPIEKWLSRYTDVLITINKEDYKLASERFRAKETVYVPGIGIDTAKFAAACGRERIRKELGIGENDIMLLSVGELSDRKNHQAIVRAIAGLGEKQYYVIVGRGEKQQKLKSLAAELGIEEQLKLAGFRADVADFYDAADLFVFPSLQEGLPVALMEAMASGLGVVCSGIRGNTDLIDPEKGGFLFDPHNTDEIAACIRKALAADRKEMGRYNLEKVRLFDRTIVRNEMEKIYKGL